MSGEHYMINCIDFSAAVKEKSGNVIEIIPTCKEEWTAIRLCRDRDRFFPYRVLQVSEFYGKRTASPS